MRITDRTDWHITPEQLAIIGWIILGMVIMLALVAGQSPCYRLALWLGGLR